MAKGYTELNTEDYRYIYIQTSIGEICMWESEEGVRISVDGETPVVKMNGENSFTIKVEK